MTGAATTAGHATLLSSEKDTGAGEACRRKGITLMPVVVESLGGWGKEAVRVVRRLAGALARHTGQKEKGALRPGFSLAPNFRTMVLFLKNYLFVPILFRF